MLYMEEEGYYLDAIRTKDTYTALWRLADFYRLKMQDYDKAIHYYETALLKDERAYNAMDGLAFIYICVKSTDADLDKATKLYLHKESPYEEIARKLIAKATTLRQWEYAKLLLNRVGKRARGIAWESLAEKVGWYLNDPAILERENLNVCPEL